MNDFITVFKNSEPNIVNDALSEICLTGNVEVMHLLLTSPELKYKADIDFRDGIALCNAIFSGRLEAVDFLLTSPLLKKHATLTEKAFLCAARGDNLDIVKYLLSSPKLKIHADVTCDDYHALYLACTGNKQNFIDYYLKDLKVEVSDQWIKYSNRFLKDFDWHSVSKAIKSQKLADTLELKLESKQPQKMKKI